MNRESYKICRSEVQDTTAQVKEYCDKLIILREMIYESGSVDMYDLKTDIMAKVMIAGAMIFNMAIRVREMNRDIYTFALLAVFAIVIAYLLSASTYKIRQLFRMKKDRSKLIDALVAVGLSGTLEMELIIGAYALYEAETDEASISEITGLFRLYNDEAGIWLTDDNDIAVMADDRYQISRKLLRGKEIDLRGLQRDIDKVKYVINYMFTE